VRLCAQNGSALTMVNIRQKARAVLAILLSVIGESPVSRRLERGAWATAMNHQYQQVAEKFRYA
jgi:hypothetical protein